MKKLILTIALLTSIGAQAKENNIVSILVGSGPTGGIINNVTTKGLARGTVEGLMYQHRIKNSELFLKGHTIKHKRNMDVAYKVMAVIENDLILDLWISVLNQGYVKTWEINKHFNMKIEKKNISDWSYCLSPHDKCIRYSQWKPVR